MKLFFVWLLRLIVKRTRIMSMSMSKYFVLCLLCSILMIIYQEFTSVSNYIPSNQYNGLKQQDLRQWMNEKEQNYQKDAERIQEICKKYNVKSRKLIEK